MDEERKNIEDLAKAFSSQWRKTPLPDMDAVDLLDLMDYYARSGMTFEAELCRYIATTRYPNDPEVLLTQAHSYADDGDWISAAIARAKGDISGYDDMLFKVEHSLRIGKIAQAVENVRQAIPYEQDLEATDYDFIFDSAVIFRDFGYCQEALLLLEQLPPSYSDYNTAMQLRVECHILLRQYDAAKKLLNVLLDHASFDQTLWVNMATCCFEQGAYDETLEACEYALAIGDNSEANHLRLMVHIRKNCGRPNEDLFHDIMTSQDYRACTEYGDTLVENGHQEEAFQAYGFAHLFCAQGNRDESSILARIVLVFVRQGNIDLAKAHARALLAHQDDCWDTLHEAAIVLLEEGNVAAAIGFLNMATEAHFVQGVRYNQLAALLSHYNIYKEAQRLWEDIALHEASLLRSFRPYLDRARRELCFE